MNRKITKRILADLSVIFFSAVSYYGWEYLYTEKGGNKEDLFLRVILLFLASFKVAYFFIYSLELLNRTLKKKETFSSAKFFGALFYIIVLVQISFATDFNYLLHLDAYAFEGLKYSYNTVYTFFEFFYFAVITFATVGYGDIKPITLAAKALVSIEVLSSILFIVFVVSNFSSIKEGFSQNPPRLGHLDDID